MPNAAGPLATCIQRELDGVLPPGVRRLHEVPQHLRSLDEDGYTPRIVSIGPFHHGKSGLEEFEEEKLRCLQAFLSWSGLNLETLIQRVIVGKEDKLESFYAQGIVEKFGNDSFQKLILVDATFIVVVILGYHSRNLFRSGNDCLNQTVYTNIFIKRDLALVENQVPLFILVDLYYVIKTACSDLKWPFFKLATRFFEDVTLRKSEISDIDVDLMTRSSSSPENEDWNLVDMLIRYHRPSQPRMNPRRTESSYRVTFRSLTELYECGVRLKSSTREDALDIRYSNGTLEIPKIISSKETVAVLENMVSFEQCYCKEERYVTDYVNLMANLVRSPNDVELLIRHGVLDGWLNQDICKFFYDLGRESFFSHKFYYRRLCEDLDDYCKAPWHMWRALLRHEYLQNPFAVVAACLYFLIALLDLLEKGRWGTIFTSFCCLGLAYIAQFYA